MGEQHRLYVTSEGTEILVLKGKKVESPYDFIVKYREQGKRLRTPKHIHPVVELYVKQAHKPRLAEAFVKELLMLFDRVEPVDYFPPQLQIFNNLERMEEVAGKYRKLDDVGEFSVEFLLVVSELIFIQEKTNYPQGSATRKLYEKFLSPKNDRFQVINAATQGRAF